MLKKIISGGQTGADQAGLIAGRALGLETGGTASPNFVTEIGRNSVFLKSYGLVEGEADASVYKLRTLKNVIDSDGTVIFSKDLNSPGTVLTKSFCIGYKKPFIMNPTEVGLRTFIGVNKIEILNVAGNRESKTRGIQLSTYKFLLEALGLEKGGN